MWARLRVRDGVKVGRRRVLHSAVRENNLLSPYRGRRGTPHLHEGEIITQAPNLMWGAGRRRVTVEEGWGWTFVAVEHWNAECVGWHVCKQGTRFAALEPIPSHGHGRQGGRKGRGLSLRIDHGTQYLSDHFLNQLKYWGINPTRLY